jgi:microcystin-dependent protein
MSSPYVGEIRIFAGNFAPVGWALCNGQVVPISENPTLFQLIGTTYGGDGQSTFNLPNLQSRVPIHQGTDPHGNNYPLGQAAGTETVTLTTAQIPQHSHAAVVSAGGNTDTPVNNYPGADPQGADAQWKANTQANATMNGNAIATAGGSQPHTNIQPYLAINYIISLFGIFPTQN